MNTNLLIFQVVATLVVGSSPTTASASDESWPQLLGPQARAISTNADLPDKWSATENVAWKTPIPGRGWSSPIAWGDRVFLTTVVGGEETETPKKGLYMGGERPDTPSSEYQWKVLCLDLSTGRVLWEEVVHHGDPSGPKHSKNSYASETPVTDGKCVYAYFGNLGVFCLDMEGHPVWSKTLEPHATRNGWGTAASPVLHRDRLYLVNDNEEKSYLLALDKRTGKEVWRVDRDEKSNWATPYVWEIKKQTEIITPGTGKVRAYDLNGKLLWWFKGMSGITVATPYSDHGLLYVSSGFVADKQRPLYAIRPEANGDISLPKDKTTNEAIAWSNPTAAPYNPTSLVYEGRLYVLYDRGLLGAFDARTGGRLYEPQKLPNGKHFTASSWANNGRIFCLNEDGVTFVARAGGKFDLLGTNKLADDDMCMATPAMVGDRLLIRTSARNYCIRKTMVAQ
jgi:outer membrane protein assembly factor BamB